MALNENTLEQILSDCDWAHVFGEESDGNTDSTVEAVPPGSTVSIASVKREDIAEIIASADGENEGAEWVGLFRLNDGRYLVADGACDYTGWDCQADNNLFVAGSLNDAIVYGLNESQRLRLQLVAPAEESDRR